jgi:cyclic pyranopterin monophosphate synthase
LKTFTHTNRSGQINMVSIKDKPVTFRVASAYGELKVSKHLLDQLKKNKLQKGDVLTTAKIAGIQGAKKTHELIPLCHNILISKIDIDIELDQLKSKVLIYSYAESNSQTGIEMEALTAVSIAALTIYDMCKAVEKDIKILKIQLLSKSGGKSGNFIRKGWNYGK